MSSSTGAVSSGNPQSQSGRSAAVKSSMELEYSKKGYRDPWSYVEAQAKWVKSKKGLDEEKDWASSSHLMYAHFEVDEQGFVKAVERTLRGLLASSREEGEARNVTDFRGKRAIKWLIVAKVVPKLETGYHAAFDAGAFASSPMRSCPLMDETRRLQGIIHLLISFWMLDDDSTEEDIRASSPHLASASSPTIPGSSQRVDFETGKVEDRDPIDAQAYDEVTLDAPSSPPLAHPPRMPAALSPRPSCCEVPGHRFLRAHLGRRPDPLVAQLDTRLWPFG
ncbi:hypothetical protein Rt10032_c32g6886 [Rhodotorula toruloides]|uniref:Uncharacterized protein n=1 Tax=Rhodotorula toruloides TaxID=5286 RepID=A0A511KR90_RHOTO|nr:hypothetical protein Rt10032_c32g6886 [Rhodotorula toruloides]